MKRFTIFSSVFCALLAISLFLPTVNAGQKPGFTWKDQPEKKVADLYYNGNPVLQYVYPYDATSADSFHDTYKVFHHVYGPASKAIITKGPGGKYTHHRGLYVGWNKTKFEGKQLDFWHCKSGAHLRHAKMIEMKGDADSGTMTSEIHWNDAEGKPVIQETRKVTVRPIKVATSKNPAWQIDWQTTLNSKRGEIKLDGDRQHAGFQYRAAQAVAESNNATYVRPEGFPQQPAPFQVSDKTDPNGHINLGWFAMTYEIDGKRYNVEYFEDPSVPKPSRYSERPYGRFGAFFDTKFDESKPLKMKYRIVVSEGQTPTQKEVQKRYDQFVASLKK
ncbi:MAG: PmoA family protein [Gimesia sp.]|nr:PmoA family protein [Gimesia sp.]